MNHVYEQFFSKIQTENEGRRPSKMAETVKMPQHAIEKMQGTIKKPVIDVRREQSNTNTSSERKSKQGSTGRFTGRSNAMKKETSKSVMTELTETESECESPDLIPKTKFEQT